MRVPWAELRQSAVRYQRLVTASRRAWPSSLIAPRQASSARFSPRRAIMGEAVAPPTLASDGIDAAVLPFPGNVDFYGGVTIDADSLPEDPAAFSGRLEHSLQEWASQGKRGIWLLIPAGKANLVGPAVAMGFAFHHAEGPPSNYVMLTKWLPQEENKLPANASHQGVWKLPTGLVGAGEDVPAAAEREVAEETGVVTRFATVLALRQAHGFAFGKSDLFFLTALRPEPGQDVLVPQESEISAVQWMPLQEYATLPFLQSRPVLARICAVCLAYAESRYAGMHSHKLAHGAAPQHQLLLHGPLEGPG